jgi:serine/threonine protein kinase
MESQMPSNAPDGTAANAPETCNRSEDDVFDFFLDLSEGCENPEMKRHVQECPRCNDLLGRFKIAEKAVANRPQAAISGRQQFGPHSTGPGTIGGYEIVEQIGEGGMGSVWKARQITDGKTVALKLLFKRLTSDLQFVQRFQREASIGVKLEHPNLIKCLEVAEANGCHFMALEYVDGQDLGAVLSHRSALPEAQSLAITAAAARGIGYAHTMGLVHRDIKPANLMLTRAGQVKVMDFGLAHWDSQSQLRLTVTGAVMGTPHYISPEQVDCKTQIDGRSDIYSLGVTLFHMLTGRPPFIGRNMYDVLTAHLNMDVPDPRSINSTISAETATLVLWMCARNRERRPPNMETVVQAIGKIMGLPSAESAPGVPADFSTTEIELDFEDSEEPALSSPKKLPQVRPDDLILQIPTLIQPIEPPKRKPSAQMLRFVIAASILAGFIALCYLIIRSLAA